VPRSLMRASLVWQAQRSAGKDAAYREASNSAAAGMHCVRARRCSGARAGRRRAAARRQAGRRRAPAHMRPHARPHPPRRPPPSRPRTPCKQGTAASGRPHQAHGVRWSCLTFLCHHTPDTRDGRRPPTHKLAIRFGPMATYMSGGVVHAQHCACTLITGAGLHDGSRVQGIGGVS